MPIQLTPARPYIVIASQLREVIKDYPDQNLLLLGKVQWSDDQVYKACELIVSKFNVMPPYTSYTPQGVPEVLRYTILCGTAALLFAGEAALQLRNRATAQDGDVAPAGIFDKHSEYLQACDYFKNEFEQGARGWKTQVNAEACFGGFSSGYVTRRIRRRTL